MPFLAAGIVHDVASPGPEVAARRLVEQRVVDVRRDHLVAVAVALGDIERAGELRAEVVSVTQDARTSAAVRAACGGRTVIAIASTAAAANFRLSRFRPVPRLRMAEPPEVLGGLYDTSVSLVARDCLCAG